MIRENELAIEWPSVSSNFRVHENAFQPYEPKTKPASEYTHDYYEIYQSDTARQTFTRMNRKHVRTAVSAARMRLMIFVVVIISSAFIAGGFLFGQESTGMETPVYETVRVVSGDTLWDIARTYAPQDKSIRSFISEIKDVNDLSDSTLQIGMVLRIPVV
jgi:hypothetical protein